jgi:hypothetical protein
MDRLLAFVLALVAVAASSCTAFNPQARLAAVDPAEIASAPIGDEPNLESFKQQIEEQVRLRLRDPDSARFRWTKKFWREPYIYSPTDTVRIGWRTDFFVNSKNGFGGYGGELRWAAVVVDGTLIAIGVPPDYGGRPNGEPYFGPLK